MVYFGIDWGKIFSVPFWLEAYPGDLSPYFERLFLGVLIINYAGFGIIKYFQKRLIAKREFILANFWAKAANMFLTMAVSFSFIFFFRYEAIPILGGRFWVFVWLLIGIVWSGYLIWFYLIKVPEQFKELEKKQSKAKYLIQLKKKK